VAERAEVLQVEMVMVVARAEEAREAMAEYLVLKETEQPIKDLMVEMAERLVQDKAEQEAEVLAK
jgi:hypothetical protein